MRQFARGLTVGIVLTLLLVGSISYADSLTRQIEVTVLPLRYVFDGQEKSPPADQQGFVYNGRTYVPLRFVAESLGKDVAWDGANNLVTIGKGAPPAQTPTAVFVNGAQLVPDVPPLKTAETVYLPVRSLAEALGTNSRWDEITKTVILDIGVNELRLNEAGVTVNGTKISTLGTIVQGGRTMVPVKPVATGIGAIYQEQGGNVYITTKATPPAESPAPSPPAPPSPVDGSWSKPIPAGSKGAVTFDSFFSGTKIEAEITVLESLRGDAAWNRISALHPFQGPPPSGYEYLAVRMRFTLLSSSVAKKTYAYELNPLEFQVLSAKGEIFGDDAQFGLVGPPNPEIWGRLNVGETKEGWAAFALPKDEPDPLIRFGSPGDGMLWLRLK